MTLSNVLNPEALRRQWHVKGPGKAFKTQEGKEGNKREKQKGLGDREESTGVEPTL